ncbi:MAG: NAD(P)/FAD-dependent oxidoreductase [Pseudomonadota bacterium]
MHSADIIIVGGGPAGASCATALVAAGREVLVLDAARFPRDKLCAGWVTEKVLRDLDIGPETYGAGILPMRIRTHLPRLPVPVPGLPTPGRNYAIRRYEFDAWHLQRSGAPVVTHRVRDIARTADGFEIDGAYRCRLLIGAGGTMCPVRREVFDAPRPRGRQIVTLEHEFQVPGRGDRCHLYFFRGGIAGYAWFVPKAGDWVNIGIGAKAKWFKRRDTTIHAHFADFLQSLVRTRLLPADAVADLKVRGHPYYLHTGGPLPVRAAADAWLIGDALGLATVDLGEGIGPAIESGQRVAREILGGAAFDSGSTTRFSTSGLTQRLAGRFLGGRAAHAPVAEPVQP